MRIHRASEFSGEIVASVLTRRIGDHRNHINAGRSRGRAEVGEVVGTRSQQELWNIGTVRMKNEDEVPLSSPVPVGAQRLRQFLTSPRNSRDYTGGPSS